jgi:molybdenum cofactor biosynthesis enzyme MoaA
MQNKIRIQLQEVMQEQNPHTTTRGHAETKYLKQIKIRLQLQEVMQKLQLRNANTNKKRMESKTQNTKRGQFLEIR